MCSIYFTLINMFLYENIFDQFQMCYFLVLTESSAVNSPITDTGDQDIDDDGTGLHKIGPDTSTVKVTPAPRWPTRVFALECMLKIMLVCDGKPEQFDMVKAKQLHAKTEGMCDEGYVTAGRIVCQKCIVSGHS